jgi:hypothetical protein
MHTERFRQLRKVDLAGSFNKRSVIQVWRKIVRGQLRSLDIKDLFDHYDFNYNIEDRAISVKNDILNGTYKVSTPLIYRIEKKYGVCRHLVIPQPIDALVLQVLVESIAKKIIDKQPSKNSFYSRDKHNVPKPHEAVEYGLSFRKQWKKLQKKIYKFNESKNLLIVTDLSNYYDSISLDELRKVFVSLVETNEVIVDLLFKVIEGIAWKPDYLPYSGRGLPTANIEAIRLLAHSFLFEIDDVIKRKTENSFARWMDDFTIGVDERKEAIALISSISDMLKSRGLALNLSKTAIYDNEAASHHFQIEQNKYLDSIESIKRGNPNYSAITKALKNNFKKHFKDQSPKYWVKVARRYITAFGKLESRRLLADLPNIYVKYPGLRQNLLIYLVRLGYSTRAAAGVFDILDNLDVFDDISLFQISYLLTLWEIPNSKLDRKKVKIYEDKIARITFTQKEPSGFFSLLWFKAKYSNSKELLNFLFKYQNFWQADSFLRRQATACLSRLLTINEKTNGKKASVLLHLQVSSGIQGTVSVANQISYFRGIVSLDRKLSYYLFPKKIQRPYPLPKFLVLCSVLNSRRIREDVSIRDRILKHITDPTYRKWLALHYGISK